MSGGLKFVQPAVRSLPAGEVGVEDLWSGAGGEHDESDVAVPGTLIRLPECFRASDVTVCLGGTCSRTKVRSRSASSSRSSTEVVPTHVVTRVGQQPSAEGSEESRPKGGAQRGQLLLAVDAAELLQASIIAAAHQRSAICPSRQR